MIKVMNYNLGNNSISLLLIGLIVLLLPTRTSAQTEQKQLTLLTEVQNLRLDSTNAGELLYYSEGYSERAEVISKQAERIRLFYFDSLGIELKITIALLDTVDYAKVSSPYPYGLPFVSDGLIFQPADTSIGAVRSMYAPFAKTASKKIISNLKNAGFEYGNALNYMVDLITLHEIGHTQIYSYELDAKQAWFNEFMASYFGYAYMKNKEPKMAVVWDNIMQAGFEGYDPKHRTLNELNELYIGVGVGDYVWFQNAFQERIKEVYAKRGLDFIRLAKEKLSDPAFEPKTSFELLEALEEIEPGFIKWAETLEQK